MKFIIKNAMISLMFFSIAQKTFAEKLIAIYYNQDQLYSEAQKSKQALAIYFDIDETYLEIYRGPNQVVASSDSSILVIEIDSQNRWVVSKRKLKMLSSLKNTDMNKKKEVQHEPLL